MHPPILPPPPPPPNRKAPQIPVVQAIYDFTPTNTSHRELAVRRGQKFKLINKGAEWSECELFSGACGIVPTNYFRILPPRRNRPRPNLFFNNVPLNVTPKRLEDHIKTCALCPIHAVRRWKDNKPQTNFRVTVPQQYVDTIISKLNESYIDGSQITVSRYVQHRRPKPANVSKLFIGNVNYKTTPANFTNHFKSMPGFFDAVLAKKPDGRKAGFGFVHVRRECEDAVIQATNGSELDGRNLVVERAKDKDKDSRTPSPRADAEHSNETDTDTTETETDDGGSIPPPPVPAPVPPAVAVVRLQLIASTEKLSDYLPLTAGTIVTTSSYDPSSHAVYCRCEANPDQTGWLPMNYLKKL